MIKTVTRDAFAKINLGLNALRKRTDGYHELAMVMQTVDICDELTFTVKETPGIELYVEWSKDGWTNVMPENFLKADEALPVPSDQKNLVWRAAELLMNEFGINKGVKITLKKRIENARGVI